MASIPLLRTWLWKANLPSSLDGLGNFGQLWSHSWWILPSNKACGNLVFPQCSLSSYVSGIPTLWVVQWFPVMFPLGFVFVFQGDESSSPFNHGGRAPNDSNNTIPCRWVVGKHVSRSWDQNQYLVPKITCIQLWLPKSHCNCKEVFILQVTFNLSFNLWYMGLCRCFNQ